MSLRRIWAVMAKEFVQMRRDRLTFAMMIGVPFIQLVLFGFAINTDPKHLPAAVVATRTGPFVRELLAEASISEYLRLDSAPISPEQAQRGLVQGRYAAVLWIPPDFEARLLRHETPRLLVEIDGSDPVSATAVLRTLRSLPVLQHAQEKVALSVHLRFNPERSTRNVIVPALAGVILTMTMVLVTAIALARERERGTMEQLLVMPYRPLEIIVGKLVPYVFVGYLQVGLILLAARFVFDVPLRGSLALLLLLMLPFIAANLGMGVTFSTLARNQMQAMQMSFFFFLPSILLSGFMFPFLGMPAWAQAIGELLPLTHFLRIVRGILLKGASFSDVAPELWPILGFFVFSLTLAVVRFRRTLD